MPERDDRAQGRPAAIACPLCIGHVPIEGGATQHDDEGRLITVLRCRRCQSMATTATAADPSSAETMAVAGDDHSIDVLARPTPDLVMADATTVARAIAGHLPAPDVAGRIIDLGVGRGGLCDALRRLGHRVSGCEPSAFLCQMARASYLLGSDVLTNTGPDDFLTMLEQDEDDRSAIVLRGVLDRHPDPAGLLQRCCRLLPDGLLLLEFAVAGPDRLAADRRLYPTPATLLHLADELDLLLIEASLGEVGGLVAIFRTPAPDVIDLRQRRIELSGLASRYRERSPAFAHHFPEQHRPTATGAAGVGGES